MEVVTVSREEIGTVLARYLAAAPDRGLDAAPLVSALGLAGDVASRKTFPLHVTCSAAVVDAVGDVLMVRHRAQRRWRLPGGHIEPQDPSMYGAALRGLEAATGVAWHHTVSSAADDDVPVDISIHSVPADPVKGEPSHVHADFRYAFTAGEFGMSMDAGGDTAFAWRPPYDLPSSRFGAMPFAYHGHGWKA
ncbi:NUDIX domain-containing protein [Nonomuraea phyllanthi]|uniref:NUDIX domain-containing protein n=1 Tax=Nonomuraea phyllanthi TaxID=2219224 RepID=A0A5C4WFK7_9ACTN|nr:NUDIX domain-containing protein [Nonomuraea phyllanthi]KAB8193807.1 NUDIX domain-containing protein [Nonomuraea phyllanthi]